MDVYNYKQYTWLYARCFVCTQLYAQLKMKYDVKGQLHKLIKPPKEEIVVKKKEDFIVHTLRMEEQIAFSNWINLWVTKYPYFCSDAYFFDVPDTSLCIIQCSLVNINSILSLK